MSHDFWKFEPKYCQPFLFPEMHGTYKQSPVICKHYKIKYSNYWNEFCLMEQCIFLVDIWYPRVGYPVSLTKNLGMWMWKVWTLYSSTYQKNY